MSSVNGKLITCDRCGAHVFLRCTGEKEADGGFTRWNSFENAPEGWKDERIDGKLLTLCPRCKKEWVAEVEKFVRMTKKEDPK